MRYFVKREEEAFITVDGQKLYTLQDLIIWLKGCSDNSFKYHVNEKENHFVNWIKFSIGIENLAKKIENLRNKEDIIKAIEDFINEKEEIIEEI